MPRRIWSDGEEVVQSDLSVISAALELELYDRYGYETRKRQGDCFFGDSFLVSYINSTTSQVKKGSGLQTDNTQVDPEPINRQHFLSANTNVIHTAADGTFNRIDIVCARADRATSLISNRNYKDPITSNISPTAFNLETDWLSTLLVVAGVPSGSPAVPATPAGYVKLSEVLVTSGSGISGAGAYTDKRSRFKFQSSYRDTITKTSSHTMDFDHEIVLLNANGGAFVVTLLPVAQCAGKKVTYKKIDSSVNAITIQGSGSETIDGTNIQSISAQYTALTLQCDGSQWYLI